MKVLIVDDDSGSRALLRAQLEAEKFAVKDAADGIEAIDVLEREPVDAIIADVLMPRMDGYRLCHTVRRDPRWRQIPFITYTATYISRQDEKLSRELGADRFIRKPAPPAVLIRALQEVRSVTRPPVVPESAPHELELMREYSERLVAKLEERNVELEHARNELRDANASLEDRVRERTRQLEEANGLLDSFASFVSHELRAPLRAIVGYTERLEEEFASQMPEGAHRYLSVIKARGAMMNRLIDGLLTFCRLGQQPLQRRMVDPGEVVRSVLVELEAERAAGGVDVQVAPLPRAAADPALLRHVFINLLANAFKFSREVERPRVEVGSNEVSGEVVYFVRDNGVGFDPRFTTKIFDPFQRLHHEPGYEGAGVGLSVVQTVVQRHGGRIWADSAVGKGATFNFTLGRRVSVEAPPSEQVTG